jgi:hypothetical protein
MHAMSIVQYYAHSGLLRALDCVDKLMPPHAGLEVSCQCCSISDILRKLSVESGHIHRWPMQADRGEPVLVGNGQWCQSIRAASSDQRQVRYVCISIFRRQNELSVQAIDLPDEIRPRR